MKKLLMLSLILIFAVAIGFSMVYQKAYFIIIYQDYMVKTPFWLAVCALGVTLLIVWGILAFIRGVILSPRSWYKRALANRKKKNIGLLKDNLAHTVCGEWELVKKQSDKKTLKSDSELGAYARLLELKAMLVSGDYVGVETSLLNERANTGKQPTLSWLLASAMMNRNKDEKAEKELKKAIHYNPKHAGCYALLAQLYLKNERYWDLKDLLNTIEKNRAFSPRQFENWQKKAFVGLLHKSSEISETTFECVFDGIPSTLKKHHAIVVARIKGLYALGHDQKANQLVKKQMNTWYDRDLFIAYANARHRSLNQAFRHMTYWLTKHGVSPTVSEYEALARIALRNKDYESAENACRSALHLEPSSPRIYLLLAGVYAKRNQHEKEKELKNKAIALLQGD
jgi:uncharacterized protein HemY